MEEGRPMFLFSNLGWPAAGVEMLFESACQWAHYKYKPQMKTGGQHQSLKNPAILCLLSLLKGDGPRSIRKAPWLRLQQQGKVERQGSLKPQRIQ